LPKLSDFENEALLGGAQPLSAFADKLVLIVNVASKCGLTPQYEGLEALYQKYADKVLVVLGFPCNQFKGQEPGGAEDIAEFCTSIYGVKFPMFAKIDVNGKNADPLYQWLKAETPGSNNADIEWNFAKFLVGRDGEPIKRYSSQLDPMQIEADIVAALG